LFVVGTLAARVLLLKTGDFWVLPNTNSPDLNVPAD